MENLIDEIWQELEGLISSEQLIFLKKCFRAYSSKAHLTNVKTDLRIVEKLTPPPRKVLDFGCGIGLQSYFLANIGYQVYGLETIEDKSLEGFFKGRGKRHIATRDASMKSVWEVIQKKIKLRFQYYDGKHIPFPEQYFDVIVAYAVIEHIPLSEVEEIIRELKRVLKSNGFIYVFQLPSKSSYTEFIARHLGLESHEILWSFHDINRLLSKYNLKIIYKEKVDMLINHPYKLINPLYSILKIINKFLIHTPLSYFAHHLTVVAQKLD